MLILAGVACFWALTGGAMPRLAPVSWAFVYQVMLARFTLQLSSELSCGVEVSLIGTLVCFPHLVLMIVAGPLIVQLCFPLGMCWTGLCGLRLVLR